MQSKASPREDSERFAAFFRLLPRTFSEAGRLALRHATRLLDPAAVRVPRHGDAPLRHCVEIRNDSFITPDFIQLLREHNIGLVPADTVDWPLLLDVTSDFIYCRLHGSEQLYASGYEPPALDLWASRIHTWARGGTPQPDLPFQTPATQTPSAQPPARLASPIPAPVQPRDVFVYFDNDAKVRAPFDAQALRTRVNHLINSEPQIVNREP